MTRGNDRESLTHTSTIKITPANKCAGSTAPRATNYFSRDHLKMATAWNQKNMHRKSISLFCWILYGNVKFTYTKTRNAEQIFTVRSTILKGDLYSQFSPLVWLRNKRIIVVSFKLTIWLHVKSHGDCSFLSCNAFPCSWSQFVALCEAFL